MRVSKSSEPPIAYTDPISVVDEAFIFKICFHKIKTKIIDYEFFSI